ncbi:pyruvate kinase [Celerinatantimonas yamalensis]|uniref:Pyruvate kinase n=1 Tax=Celerinatantimonas yamalensis TaxID=559956 RepID=A0ABW9G8C2_9GAMM
MFRRTKIVATLGPATEREEVLEQMILAGVNMVRLNFSHGLASDHQKQASRVRELAAKHHTHVAIMGDLQGPKIRISTFQNDAVILKIGDDFCLDANLAPGQGSEQIVGIDYKALATDVHPGDILLLDDGRIQLEVCNLEGWKVHCRVTVGGKLSNNKGINKKGGGLSASALTDKDKKDLHTAAAIGVDYLAISFPRNGDDMRYARSLAEAAGLHQVKLVAKVERAETVVSEQSMIDIITASDAVMVARGDLGVEIGDAELVGVQKKLIRLTRKLNRVAITATQMMESMINSPMPTRAETMDVANAVLDGTDAVMLSGETAVGNYPVETVKAMANVCQGAEKHPSINVSRNRADSYFTEINETIAMATMFAANHQVGMKAIITLTESGSSALLTSRLSSGLPILALSRHQRTLNRCALFRGVYPVYFDVLGDINQVIKSALAELKGQGYLQNGDLVVLTHGDETELSGSTNTCKLLKVS